MTISLPEGYELIGAAEGTRWLVEREPVFAQTAAGPGTGKLEHAKRPVAECGKKAKKKTIETLAWLDYDSRNGVSKDDRLACLASMASIFREFGEEA